MLPLLFFLEVFTDGRLGLGVNPWLDRHLHLDLRAGSVGLEVYLHTQIQIYYQTQRVPQ